MQRPATSVSVIHEDSNQIFVIDNHSGSAKISLYGAQVISFIPKSDSRERLWLSPQTHLDGSEVIRGGVPLCWPWFANQFPNQNAGNREENSKQSEDRALPSHGFLRNTLWTPPQITEPDPGTTQLVFSFDASPRPGFKHTAAVTFTVTVCDTLTMSLQFTNTGTTDFQVTGALHSYFQVNHLDKVQLKGLTAQHKDKTLGFAIRDTPQPYVFLDETDHVHLSNPPNVSIDEGDTQIDISAQGHDSYVVWNPGAEAVKSISNIADEDYCRFLCVEAAVTSELTIAPGNGHILQQVVA